MNKKYILTKNNLNNLKSELKNKDKILLFLDYDGTLAPFKPDPLSAFALPEIEKELKKIEQSEKYNLSLVSGRKLSQLKNMIKLSQSNYAGSHGLEIELSFLNKVIYPAQNNKEFDFEKSNYQKVKNKYLKMSAVKVEDKGFGLALHFNSEAQKEKKLKELKKLFKKENYQVISGRQVLEIRPEVWDKGKAVAYISEQLQKKFNLDNYLRIYIGDDRTDEDAFKEIDSGFTIYVQNQADLKTEAEYYLKNPRDTAKLLKVIAGVI